MGASKYFTYKNKMSLFTSHRIYILFISFLILITLSFIAWVCMDFMVDLWWYNALDYGLYFIMREGYWIAITLGTTLTVVSVVYLNLWLVSKFMGSRYSVTHLVLLSLLISVPVLLPAYVNWEQFLFFYTSSKTGVLDPVYGKDISFYLFSYPVYKLIQWELLTVFSLLFTFISFYYWRAYKKEKQHLNDFPKKAKIHLTILILVITGIVGWSIVLERFDMLYESYHEPVFFGPGVVEMKYHLPLMWLSFLAFAATTVTAIYYIYNKQGLKLLAGFAVTFLVLLGVREISFFPRLINRIYVSANPVQAERQFIQNNINSTLHAFGLDQAETLQYPIISSLTPEASTEIKSELTDIPLWDNPLLTEVFNQLQTIRPYFQFNTLSVDRYILDEKEYQVNLAAREVSLDKLPEAADNWKNRHLIYTHGYGVAMMSSTQKGNQPINWLLSGITSTSKYAKLNLQYPEIFYGLGEYEYAIVPNTATTTVASNTGDELRRKYTGSGGLSISSLLRKTLFSIFFGDQNILFSADINNNSRVLLRRNIIERINAIAPFLQLDAEPYPVIANNKIYWIVDAYTTTDNYPLVSQVNSPFTSPDSEISQESINYVRNSVKIIVDAYNGSVDFFIVDDKDPIIRTLANAFPTLFKDQSEIPQALIKHINYPKDLFTLQMHQYARYHQTDPVVFFQQSDAMEFSRTDNIPVEPYFLSIDPLERESQDPAVRQKFLLVSPLSPLGQENLRMIGIAGCLFQEHCDTEYRDDILMYTFSRDKQIHGPEQINSLIAQNPEISSQLTLWNQRGSKVLRGRIITVPVGKTILYVQPVYVQATNKTSFPQLTRVIVALDQQVAMDISLEGAFNKLLVKLNGR